jgi:hypothetical protein
VDVVTRGALVVAVALAGCYEPQVRDCTIACSFATDCADGQTCGGDGWCAAPDVAGSCDERRENPDAMPPPDAEPPIEIDASVPDAPGPDAMPDVVVKLRVVVEGRGKVLISPLDEECIGVNNGSVECPFNLGFGSVQHLVPVTTGGGSTWVGWTTGNCSASPNECVVTLTDAETLVVAKFD